jgi:hypothetical protein
MLKGFYIRVQRKPTTQTQSTADFFCPKESCFNTRKTTTMHLTVPTRFQPRAFNCVSQKENTLQNTEIIGKIVIFEFQNIMIDLCH